MELSIGWAQRMITLLMMTTLAACRPFYLRPGNFVCCLSLINNVFSPSPAAPRPAPLSPCLQRHKVCNRFCLSFLPTCWQFVLHVRVYVCNWSCPPPTRQLHSQHVLQAMPTEKRNRTKTKFFMLLFLIALEFASVYFLLTYGY